jgi:hypothetical protein
MRTDGRTDGQTDMKKLKVAFRNFASAPKIDSWKSKSTLRTYLLLTYLLTPWNGVLFEKLTDSQLVKKFPAFYGTRKFITTFTRARHLFLP